MEISFRHHHHRRHELDERALLLLIIDGLIEIDAKLDLLLPPPPPPNLTDGTIIFQGENMGEISVPAGTVTVNAAATFIDAAGNTGVPATPPVWASADESLATVEASADGLSAVVTLNSVDSDVSDLITATATNADGSVAVASGTITVEAASPPPAPNLVSGDVAFTAGA